MMHRAVLARVCIFWVAAFGSVVAQAQVQRDPTTPPPEALATPGGAGASSQPWGSDGMAVVVREGKPYLVSGTRLYGVGQKIGAFRITRISETEVWLKSGTELRKLPLFSGIVRKLSAEPKGSNP
jgi:hypothetical protein